jgi:hypothetical protein
MSSNSAFTPWFGILLSQMPLILAYLIGIVVAVVRLPRNPRPAALVLIGCALLLASSVVSSLVQAWVFSSGSSAVSARAQVLVSVNIAITFVRAGGFVLLIIAAFVARTEPEGAAFPVGQAEPGGPPIAQRFG